MRSTTRLSLLLLLSGLPTTARGEVPAPAPEQAPEQVIVTAVRRATRLERTPISVTAISGAALDHRGIRQIAQLSGSVPGLTLNESPGGFPQVSLRGVGTSSANQMLEQSVGLFVDGVYQPRARQYRDGLFDVQQLEVLKGAQGVLYGKNTSVGAITVASRDPGTTTSATLGAEYEPRFGGKTFTAATDLPISPRLRLRLAATYGDDAGYVHNAASGRDEGDTQHATARATLIADLTENLAATLKFQAGHSETQGNLLQWVASDQPGLLIQSGVRDGGLAPFVKWDGTAPFGGVYDRQTSYLPSLRLVWALPNDATLTATTAYSTFSFTNAFDSDATPATSPSIYSRFDEDFSQFSQELRYASAAGTRLSWQGGVLLLHHDDHFTYDNFFKSFYLVPAFHLLDVTGQTRQGFAQSDLAVSGFIQGDWHITPDLSLSLGARVGHETKDGTYTKAILSNFGDRASVIGTVAPLPPGPLSGQIDDTSADLSAVLSEQLTPSTLLYVSAAQGHKSGGFNNTALPAATTPNPFILRPETASTIEAGVKMRSRDGKFYLGAAAYHSHIDGYQDSYFSAAALGFIARSANANLTGMEAESRWQILDGLTLTANTGLEPQANFTDGGRLQRAPRFSASAGAIATQALSDRYQLSESADFTYASAYLNQSPTAPGNNSSGVMALANLRIAVQDLRHHLEISLRIDNLLDRRYIAYSYGSLLATAYLAGAGGTPYGSVGLYNRPRSFILGLQTRF